jgi:hypothetical protein
MHRKLPVIVQDAVCSPAVILLQLLLLRFIRALMRVPVTLFFDSATGEFDSSLAWVWLTQIVPLLVFPYTCIILVWGC